MLTGKVIMGSSALCINAHKLLSWNKMINKYLDYLRGIRLPVAVFLLIILNTLPLAQASSEIYRSSSDFAIQWLNQQQNLDGSWGARDDIKHLYTTEVVNAMQAINTRNSANYWGIAWLENHYSTNVDYKARRIIALMPHGNNLSAEIDYLVAAQSFAVVGSNNGWGLTSGYDGSALDTALALQAYAQYSLTTNVQFALDYLKSTQQADNAWAFVEGEDSDPVTTAHVILALLLYQAIDPALSAVIDNAVTALGSMVDINSSPLEKAHAALAFLRYDNNSIQARTLIDSLVVDQLFDGSWNTDPYTTAVVVRAFASALGSDPVGLDELVYIKDANLRAAINLVFGKNRMDSLNVTELSTLTNLDATGMDITDLTGLEAAVNLISADLSGNGITDISPLVGLSNLTQLKVDGNPLSDAVDSDDDGLSDLAEANAGSNPLDVDTDDDGIGDLADVYPTIPADGDLNEDGSVNVADVLIARRIVMGDLLPDSYLGHGDVAPLNGGIPEPDGQFNLGDLVVIQRKAIGEINF